MIPRPSWSKMMPHRIKNRHFFSPIETFEVPFCPVTVVNDQFYVTDRCFFFLGSSGGRADRGVDDGEEESQQNELLGRHRFSFLGDGGGRDIPKAGCMSMKNWDEGGCGVGGQHHSVPLMSILNKLDTSYYL